MAKRKKRLSLAYLIKRGCLNIGEELTCVHSTGAEAHTAMLDEDGCIRFKDNVYTSPSGWAGELAGGKSRGGWYYVRRARDGRTLDSIEEDARKKRTPVAGEAGTEPGDPVNSLEVISSHVDHEKSKVGSSELLDRIRQLSPAEFERLVGEFLRAKGFENVIVTGRSNDGGIDGECSMPFVKIGVAFQAKRWKNNVGSEDVRQLVGSITGKFDRAILVTTSGYTNAATGWVEERNPPIVLIDGKQLVQYLIDLGLGVKEIPQVELAIDEDFFAGLS